MMAWYFAFVVFKTNKDFLSSIVHEAENPSSLDDMKSLFGTSLTEGFTGGNKEGFTNENGDNALSNIEEQTNKYLSNIIKTLNLDESGSKDRRKKITRILEKKVKVLNGYGVYLATVFDTANQKAGQEIIDNMRKAHENTKYFLELWNKQVDKIDGGSGW